MTGLAYLAAGFVAGALALLAVDLILGRARARQRIDKRGIMVHVHDKPGDALRVELVNDTGDRWATEVTPRRAVGYAGELLAAAWPRL
jgi:hypothetical protein